MIDVGVGQIDLARALWRHRDLGQRTTVEAIGAGKAEIRIGADAAVVALSVTGKDTIVTAKTAVGG